jgi:hypothetical protein
VRSFPSVYELLPTYPCLDLGDGHLRGLSGLDLPNVDGDELKKSLAFHVQISAAVEEAPRYRTFAIKGVDQPTSQSALLRQGRVESLRSYKGQEKGADGTVPRPSSHPPEWEDEGPSTKADSDHIEA